MTRDALFAAARLLLTLALPAAILGCGASGPRVRVSVEGSGQPAVARLEVRLTLDGKEASGAAPLIDRHLESFEVELPRGSAGVLTLRVGGLDAGGCRLSSGAASLHVTDGGDYPVSITLRADPGCRLNLVKSGAGGGRLVAHYGGRTTTCSFRELAAPALGDELCAPAPVYKTSCVPGFGALHANTRVTFTAEPDGDSRFAGWRGRCSNLGPCEVAVDNGDAVIEAVFVPRTLCRDDGLCWQLPLPQGNALGSVHGSSATDVWSVGPLGTMLHWDGSAWSPADVRVNAAAGLRAAFAVSKREAWFGSDRGLLHVVDGKWSCDKAVIPDGERPQLRATAIWASGPSDVWAGAGLLWHYDGSRWSGDANVGDGNNWVAITGTGPDDVFAINDSGSMMHWDGDRWHFVPGTTGAPLSSMWISPSSKQLWVGDRKGVVRRRPLPYSHADGWTQQLSGVSGLTGLWGATDDDVWAVGEGGAAHWNGGAWSQVDTGLHPNARALTSVWGSRSDDVWAVGPSGRMVHFDGKTWSTIGRTGPGVQIVTLWSAGGRDDVWAVPLSQGGSRSPLLHWNGADWLPIEPLDGGGDADRIGIWSASPNDLWIYGLHQVQRWNGDLLVPPRPIYATANDGSLIRSVWGPRSADGINAAPWMVGVIVGDRYEGGQFNRYAIGNNANAALWGSGPRDVWAVGDKGATAHWDGSRWTSFDVFHINAKGEAGPPFRSVVLSAVWGSGPSDVWTVGRFKGDANAVVAHWDGITQVDGKRAWIVDTTIPTEPATAGAVWAAGPGDVWVGTGRLLVHRTAAELRTYRLASEITAVHGSDKGNVWVATIDGAILAVDTSPPPLADHCGDGIADGDETDVDCGNSCGPCALGLQCGSKDDCESGYCSGGICRDPDDSCTNGVMDNRETDIDCGGLDCPACPDGAACAADPDCLSSRCAGGACQGGDCGDDDQNGDETDVDCGGSCPPCANGLGCGANQDCQSMVCVDELCVAPCDDGVLDGDESDVDCGGSCPACRVGQACRADGDCLAPARCAANQCK